MHQLFVLGQLLRLRYSSLVPYYDPGKVRIVSTGSERTIVSALSLAAGMFPPTERQVNGVIEDALSSVVIVRFGHTLMTAQVHWRISGHRCL